MGPRDQEVKLCDKHIPRNVADDGECASPGVHTIAHKNFGERSTLFSLNCK